MKKLLGSLFALFVFAVIATMVYAATVVMPSDLVTPPDATTVQNGWYFYDDNTNTASTAEVPGTYEFVTGIDNPPSGIGSIMFNVGTGERWTIASNQFAGMSLTDLNDLAMTIYRPDSSAGADDLTLFFNFDIDFDNTKDTGYQGRLVYVPSDNGAVTEDAWQTWDMDNGKWRWSRYASSGNMWPDTETSALRTWEDIMTAFPNAEVLYETFTGQVLVRAGHPGPDGLVGYLDSVEIAGELFDFEPALTPEDMNECKQGGWMSFNAPTFKNQGDCVSYLQSNENATGNKNK